MFFATDYCVSVDDFQCVPHNDTPTGRCEHMQRKLRNLQQDLKKRKQACDAKSSVTDDSTSNSIIDTVLIVMCVIFSLIAMLFFILFLRAWIRSRRNQSAGTEKIIGSELIINSKKESEIHQNTTVIWLLINVERGMESCHNPSNVDYRVLSFIIHRNGHLIRHVIYSKPF